MCSEDCTGWIKESWWGAKYSLFCKFNLKIYFVKNFREFTFMNVCTPDEYSYLEPNKGYLHGKDGAQTINCAVCHIDSMRKSPCEHQNQNVEGYKVDQEHIATPGGNLHANTLSCQIVKVKITPVMHHSIHSPCKSKPVHTQMTNTLNQFSLPLSTCNKSTAYRRWQYLRRDSIIYIFMTFYLTITFYVHQL